MVFCGSLAACRAKGGWRSFSTTAGPEREPVLRHLKAMRLFVAGLALAVLLPLSAGRVCAQGLTITTGSPLPSGEVGVTYSLTLEASGGRLPLSWQLAVGLLPNGLSLSATSGQIRGTPTEAGTFVFAVEVTDADGITARKGFSLIVDTASLRILTASPLPNGKVGRPYLFRLTATGGIPPVGGWTISEGALPQGLTLNSASGEISGVPSQPGMFGFTAQVSDSSLRSAAKNFSLEVEAEFLTILTDSPLPEAMVGAPFSDVLVASGGPRPFRWTLNGTLPLGLALDEASGEISGVAAEVGTFDFIVQVTDSAASTDTESIRLTVRGPTATIQVLDEAGPAQQPRVTMSLAPVYPVTLTGRLELSFTPDAAANSDDPNILFSSGSRVAEFTIAANTSDVNFGIEELALQTGTVAGTISVSLANLQSGEVDITPSPVITEEVSIARLPPALDSLGIVNRTSSGFAIEVTGFSTPREVSGAVFRFAAAAGRQLQTTQVSVQLGQASGDWFQNPAATEFGSQFIYRQPFTTRGDINAIGSVSVTLSNPQGESESLEANF